MNHPRARLSALVDGELDHDDRDRVLAHLTQCDECRAVVDTERRVKALLSGMPEPAPSENFLAALSGLAEVREAEAGGAGANSAGPGAAEAGGGEAGGAVARRVGTSGAGADSADGARSTMPQIAAEGSPLAAAGTAPGPAQPQTGQPQTGQPQTGQPWTGGPSPRRLAGVGLSTGTDALSAPVALGFGSLPPDLAEAPVGPARSGRSSLRRRSRPAPLRPRGHPDHNRRPRGLVARTRRLPIGLAGAASLAGMALVTAFVIGGQPTAPEQPARAPVERFTIEHAVNVSELPLSDRGATAALLDDAEQSGWGQADR